MGRHHCFAGNIVYYYSHSHSLTYLFPVVFQRASEVIRMNTCSTQKMQLRYLREASFSLPSSPVETTPTALRGAALPLRLHLVAVALAIGSSLLSVNLTKQHLIYSSFNGASKSEESW
jgi:hypothetical protein